MPAYLIGGTSKLPSRIFHMRQRLITFLLGFVNFVLVVGSSAGLQLLVRGRVPDLVGLSIGTALLVVLYLAGSRWIERRNPVELRRRGSVPKILKGFALGVALFSSVMAVLAICGMYRPSGLGNWRSLALGLLFAMVAAIFEEIAFRGFLFRLFAGLGGNWTALLVTALLFGLAHKANPHATLASSVAIALEAGILLGAAYAASGSLWLPVGIHAGWNFAEGSIFGMAISGNSPSAGLIGGNLHGPAILTGGTFGPEASVIAVAICLVPAVLYLRRMKRASEKTKITLKPGLRAKATTAICIFLQGLQIFQ